MPDESKSSSDPSSLGRRNLRADVELPVAWRDTRDDTTRTSTSLDLSASGMAIRSPVWVKPGTNVYVVVGHETLGFRFEVAATAVRSARLDQDAFRVSLSFGPLSSEDAAAIGRRVVRALAESRDGGVAAADAGESVAAPEEPAQPEEPEEAERPEEPAP